jgi:hypothetical protein
MRVLLLLGSLAMAWMDWDDRGPRGRQGSTAGRVDAVEAETGRSLDSPFPPPIIK